VQGQKRKACMNHFTWTKTKNSDEPQKVELTLSEGVHDIIIEPLKQQWLMPILKGQKKELPDGSTYYCFYLPSEDAEFLKEAFMQAYSKAVGYDTSN
jgi:hypothetical protein